MNKIVLEDEINQTTVEESDSISLRETTEILTNIFARKPEKPGKVHRSRPTSETIYDCSHKRSGAAVIFNQKNIKGETSRFGTDKDAKDLSIVLSEIGFDVKICKDFSVSEIKAELAALSNRDHSDNDCLFVCIMTHGKKEGKIFGADREFKVEGLWENFIGYKCSSLVGKPKLFFIQACRGTMTDPGVLCFERKESVTMLRSISKAEKTLDCDESFVIPKLADLLVMYSTAEGYYSFRNSTDGSWFIQALCEELRENDDDKDLMTILTGVNRRVAFAKQSNIPHEDDLDAMKQMPNIVSMLTKNMYFLKKSMKTIIEYA